MAAIDGKKTGGRAKGTVNKRTLLLTPITEVLAKQNFDPLKELHNIFRSTTDEGLQAAICMRLIEFIYPKKKAIEIKIEDLDDQTLIIEVNRRINARLPNP